MSFRASYNRFAFKYLGKYVRPYTSSFTTLRDNLHRAGKHYLLEEYLSIALLTSIVAFFPTNLILLLLFATMEFPLLFALPFVISIGLFVSVIVFFYFLVYPAQAAKTRARSIRINLPFAITYLATIVGAGIPPYIMFKLLASAEEYGEVSTEAKRIVRDMDVFGLDLSTALERAAMRTPSESFKEILFGIRTIIARGGNLREFLHNTAVDLMAEYGRTVKKWTSSVAMYIQAYLTVIIVGSIFSIVLTSIMATVGGGMTESLKIFQRLMIYLGLPAIAIGFILFLKAASPLGE